KFETHYQSIASVHQLGVMTYYSLASGFLTGKYRSEADLDKSQRGRDIKNYLDARGHNILMTLDEIDHQKNTTQAVIALAWLLHQATVAAPIVSATNLNQLQSIIEAPNVKLTEDEMTQLYQASQYD